MQHMHALFTTKKNVRFWIDSLIILNMLVARILFTSLSKQIQNCLLALKSKIYQKMIEKLQVFDYISGCLR